MAAPTPRKKVRAATGKTLRAAGASRRRASASSAKKSRPGPSRRPASSPTTAGAGRLAAAPPSLQVRREAFETHWKVHLEGRAIVERFDAESVAVVVAAERSPRAHWLYLTTGLWPRGLELCLKVPRRPEESAPPPWAIGAFRTLVGHAVAAGGPALTSAQVLTLGAPLAPGSEMASFAFLPEPSIGTVSTPHDEVVALLAVGLTRDEERIVREWSPQALLEVLRELDPLLATDLDRSSLLLSPRARTYIEQRVEREGSSLSVMWAQVSTVRGDGATSTWTLSADAVETFLSLLKGRVGHRRGFSVHAPGPAGLEVIPADHPSLVVAAGEGPSRLELSQPAARQLRAALRPKAGRYVIESLPALTIEVV